MAHMPAIPRRKLLSLGLAAGAAVGARSVSAGWTADPRNTLDLVRDFGAVANTDCTTQLEAAYASLGGSLRTLVVPAGRYHTARPMPPLPTGCALVGETDPRSISSISKIIPEFPEGPVLTAGPFSGIDGIDVPWFGAGVRSGPAVLVPIEAGSVTINRVRSVNGHGIESHAASITITRCRANASIPNPDGAGFLFGTGTINAVIQDCEVYGPIGAGFKITNCGDLWGSRNRVIGATRGLDAYAAPGSTIVSVWWDDFAADGCLYAGIHMLADQGGLIARSRIRTGWAAGSPYGTVLWGAVHGVRITDYDILGNSVVGAIFGPGTRHCYLHGGIIAQNGIGIRHYADSEGRIGGPIAIGAAAGLAPNGINRVLDPGALDDCEADFV